MKNKNMIIAFLKFLAIMVTFFVFAVEADEAIVLQSNSASGEIISQTPLIPAEPELNEATEVSMTGEGEDVSTNAPDSSASEAVSQDTQVAAEPEADEAIVLQSNSASGEIVNQTPLIPVKPELKEATNVSMTGGGDVSTHAPDSSASEVVNQEPQVAVEPEAHEAIEVHTPVMVDKGREVSPNTVIPVSPIHEETEEHNSPGTLVYIILFIMSLVTLVSTIISFYLYKWRRILLAQPNLLVPEEWGKYLDVVGRNMKELEASVANNINHIASNTSESTNKIDNMIETYMSLQGSLDQKDSEIRRLKKGYDAEIFRKYLSRFIQIELALDDYIHLKEGDIKIFEQLKRLFEDAFDECGVESFEPQVGEDYRHAFGVADNPKKTISGDLDKEFTIGEVLEAGYRLRNGDDYEIIKPAKVSIYKYCEQEEI